MDTIKAYLNNQEAIARGDVGRVFDWEKAARLIKERQPKRVSAGLRGDWEWTGGVIFEDGKPTPEDDTYTYLASTWAIPEIKFDDGPKEPCFVMKNERPDWDSDTYWPPEALTILNGDN